MKALLPIAALLFPTPLLAAPTLLAQDNFDSPTATRLDDTSDPLDLAYYSFTSPPSVQNGKLAVPSTPGNRFASSAFARTTLATGDSVSLKFTITGTPNTTLRFPTFNIGLYDSKNTLATDDSITGLNNSIDDRGYTLRLLHDPALFFRSSIQQDFTGLPLSGEDGFLTTPLTYLDGDQPRTFELTFRPTETAFLIDFSINGSAPLTYAFAADFPSFDNLQFGFTDQSSPDTFFLDDLSITYNAVPEPATAMLTLPALVLLRRRLR